MTSKRVNQSGGPAAKKWDFRTIGTIFRKKSDGGDNGAKGENVAKLARTVVAIPERWICLSQHCHFFLFSSNLAKCRNYSSFSINSFIDLCGHHHKKTTM
uniref:Uncharacterized protein n=1 Tax=Globodera rostochiensis TaxID=31243 RepID=A0A914H917_GLORO